MIALISLSKEKIDSIFEIKENGSVSQCMVDLYREVYKDWDEIKTIDHYPKISFNTQNYILKKFKEVNKIYESKGFGVIPLFTFWMQNGFGVSETLMNDWVVEIEIDKVTYINPILQSIKEST